MKRSLRVMTLREIRYNLGRFLSIFFIVMLGAGFLAGLRVTRTAMLRTLNDYNSENHFFDYRIVSTLGLTEEDVNYFSRMDGVESAEGSISTDAIFNGADGTESVMKVHSMPEKINLLKLRSGRLPERADECVLDAMHADVPLGGTITLSENNEQDTLDMFAGRTYTVVGYVNSPLYINFTRGTTTLGSGSVKGFLYLPRDGFDTDYDTEIYLRLSQTGDVYTDEYDDAVDTFRDTLEDAADMRGEVRYAGVVADAEQEYQEGLAEYETNLEKYNTEKADAEQELADALKDLNAAKKKLSDSRKELDDGQSQLEDARAQLAEGQAQYDESAPAALQQLEGLKAQIDAASQSGVSQQQLAQMQAQYDAGMSQLNAQKQQLSDAAAEIEKNAATLEQGEKDYTSGYQTYLKGLREYRSSKAEAEDKFADAEQELADAKVELADARSEIDDIEPATVYVLDRYTNTGYANFESDSNIVAGVAKVFPIFFFLVAALVCVTTMNRMVDEQRTRIGTLKSLGYTSREIMGGYLLYTGVASGLGSAVGVLVGSVAFPEIIWQAYNIMYGFTDIVLVFDWKLCGAVCAAFVACSLSVTWFSCRSELREVPAELVRPRTPKAGKRILLERIPFLWRRFSFLRKVSARNIFRYKKRMFMMIVGIAGCTALLIAGFGLNDSIAGLADTQFSEIYHYDAQVSFQNLLDAAGETKFLRQCDGAVKKSVFLSTYSVDAEMDGTLKSIYLVGSDETDLSDFVDFRSGETVLSYPGDGEVLINNNLADTLGVSVGDTITLQNADMDQLKLTVSGVYHNVIYNFAYVTLDTLRGAEGFSSDINSAYVCLDKDAGIYASAAKVGDCDDVMSVSVNEETRSVVDNSLGSMKYIVLLVIFCAGALAFIVLYNLTNININERIREIATIKVLGFRQKETATYVYRENMVLTLMGIAVGIPLGIWLHGYVMGNIHIDMISFDRKIFGASYLAAVVLTLVFALLVDLFMYFRLDKIDMAESLKSVE